MTARSTPPFRADHVGSFLRPQYLLEARGTSVALFASMYFLGQTAGVAPAAPVMDRYGGPPLFLVSAVLLPAFSLML